MSSFEGWNLITAEFFYAVPLAGISVMQCLLKKIAIKAKKKKKKEIEFNKGREEDGQ